MDIVSYVYLFKPYLLYSDVECGEQDIQDKYLICHLM